MTNYTNKVALPAKAFPSHNFKDPTQGVSLMALMENSRKINNPLPLQGALSRVILEEHGAPKRQDFGSRGEWLRAYLSHSLTVMDEWELNFDADVDTSSFNGNHSSGNLQ